MPLSNTPPTNQSVDLGTDIEGEDSVFHRLKTANPSSYTFISADTLIKTGVGKLKGIFVSIASATPAIKVWDNTSGATTVLIETFTPVAGTYYPFPDVMFTTGLYVDITNTVSCTVFYE